MKNTVTRRCSRQWPNRCVLSARRNCPSVMSDSCSHNDSVRHHTLWTGNTRDGQNWLAFHMQVSCRRVWSTTHSGVGGQTGSAQIWSTIHQQLWVPHLPPDVSFTDWAYCPQQVTLVMMRSVVSTAQSMTNERSSDRQKSMELGIKRRPDQPVHIIIITWVPSATSSRMVSSVLTIFIPSSDTLHNAQCIKWLTQR